MRTIIGWSVGAACATVIVTGLSALPAPAQETKNDRREIRQDSREIRGDRKEIAKDTQSEVKSIAAQIRYEQTPAYYDQISGNFYFQKPAVVATNAFVPSLATPVITPAPGTSPAIDPRFAEAGMVWTTIQATTQAARKAPLFWVAENSPSPALPSARPTMPPNAAPRRRMLRVTW